MAVSPRRIDFNHQALKKVEWDTSKPAEDSFAWRLWTQCLDLAQLALGTEFIQGIKNGSLDPRKYGRYDIQDCSYCVNGQRDYQEIELRAKAANLPEVALFAQARYDSYVSYTDELVKGWHLSGADAIKAGPAVQEYIEFERFVADTMHPMYGIIAMIPCDQLWPWLAEQLASDNKPGNVYDFWITGNAGFKGAYRLDNFVNKKHQQCDLDEHKALFVFRSCMTCEVNFFRSACGQTALPMPKPVS